jgi:uncharacterized membrane protein
VDGSSLFFLIFLVFKITEELFRLVSLSIKVKGKIVHCLILTLSFVDAILDHKVLSFVHRLHIVTCNVHKGWNKLRDILFFKFEFIQAFNGLVRLILNKH